MPSNLLDYQLCTNKTCWEGTPLKEVPLTAKACLCLACPECGVQGEACSLCASSFRLEKTLKITVLDQIQWHYCIFSFFPVQERNLLLLIPSDPLVQLGEM